MKAQKKINTEQMVEEVLDEPTKAKMIQLA
jgi:hypothetical protein